MAGPTAVPLPPGFRSQLLSRVPAHARAMFEAGAGFHGGPTPQPAPPRPAPKRKSQSVSDVANQRVNQQLAPVLAAQDAQDRYQNQAIQQFALALLGKYQPVAGQVGSDYDQAIGQTAAVAGAAANALRDANPNQQDAAMLAAINAPEAQRAEIASQLANTYGGGGAVTLFNQGQIPVTQLATDKAAAQAQARTLPTIAGLKGQQDLASALYSQRQERAKVLAQRPGMVQDQEQQIRQNLAGKQAAAYDRYKFETARADALEAAGQKLQAQRVRDQANLDYKYASLQAENRRTAATIQGENARAAAAEQGRNARTAAQIDAANQRAQLAAQRAGVKTSGKGRLTDNEVTRLVDQWRNGKVQNARVAQTDANGNVVRDSNGAIVYKTQSGVAGQLSFTQAYKRLIAFGYSDVKARQILDTAYKRGEQGRAWVTNEEQAALSRAGLPSRARVVNGRGILTHDQYLALRKVHRLPQGQLTREGYYVIAQVS